MKEKYEKPAMTKLQTGMMNKFGINPHYYKKIRTDIDGVLIDRLVKDHGSPLFVFSEKQLRSKYREFSSAFSNRYPNVVMCWSYKTNYLGAICAIMHSEGSIAEVVSEMEYDKAKRLGISGKDIMFNGPRKSMRALEMAAADGAMINVDHFDEISDLEAVAEKLNKKIKVGIRINMDTGIFPQWTRFGLNYESGQAIEAVKRISMRGKLEVNGLHCHIGTFIMDPNAYAIQVEKLIALAYEIEDKFSFKIEYLDLGGGFPSRNRLKGIYLHPDVAIPTINEYAEKITDALFKHLRPGDFPKLMLESGRAIIDEAGYLISTVVASKKLVDGRRGYVIDAGVNILPTTTWYKLNLETDREIQGMNEPAIVFGPLCMNIDVVDEGQPLPHLPRGTRMIFSPVGAYNVTQWMQFIDYRPNVVLVGEKGEVDVIREAEELDDIIRRERLPERLAVKSGGEKN